MKLREYIELKREKPYKWADKVSLPRSGVYSWLSGQTPTITNILKIKELTDGAVGPEDWVNGDKR